MDVEATTSDPFATDADTIAQGLFSDHQQSAEGTRVSWSARARRAGSSAASPSLTNSSGG